MLQEVLYCLQANLELVKALCCCKMHYNFNNAITLYISGEESEQQIKMRANRLKYSQRKFLYLTETSLSVIFTEIKKLQPSLVIIDSIQTLQSDNH